MVKINEPLANNAFLIAYVI